MGLPHDFKSLFTGGPSSQDIFDGGSNIQDDWKEKRAAAKLAKQSAKSSKTHGSTRTADANAKTSRSPSIASSLWNKATGKSPTPHTTQVSKASDTREDYDKVRFNFH
jgi:hypothetical protein